MTLIVHHDSKDAISIAVTDRCFNYGDGVFTTMACVSGHIQLLDLHISRLQLSAIKLGMVTIDWQSLKQHLVQHAPNERCVIKVLISRGVGGRGYASDNVQPVVHILHSPYPDHYDEWRSRGIGLGVSEVKLGLNPQLAGIKHCNRLEQVMIKNAMAEKPWQDEVVIDLTGAVVDWMLRCQPVLVHQRAVVYAVVDCCRCARCHETILDGKCDRAWQNPGNQNRRWRLDACRSYVYLQRPDGRHAGAQFDFQRQAEVL